MQSDLRSRLCSLPSNESKANIWWPWYNKLGPFNDWSKYYAYSIFDGLMLKVLQKNLDYLLRQSNGLQL
jgi:hypothetical protein